MKLAINTGMAPTYREISRSEVIDFLNAKKVDPACPGCGHGRSEIHVRDNDTATVVVMPGIEMSERKTALMNPNSGSMVIICECANCGLYRNFSYNALLEWVEREGVADE